MNDEPLSCVILEDTLQGGVKCVPLTFSEEFD